MDLRDLFYIGSEMLDEVNDAVLTGDYSRLGESLQRMNEKMRRDSEQVRLEQERLRQQYQEQMLKNQQAQARYRQTGQGAQYQQGSARPVPQTVQTGQKTAANTGTAQISTPFMQKRISRLSGAGRIVGGTAGLVIAVILLVTFLVLGLALSGAWMIGAGICAAFAAYMVWNIVKGFKRRKLVNLFYRFGQILGRREYFKVDDLAKQTGMTSDQVRTELKNMMKDDMLPQAKFDATESTVMLTPKMYQKYLDAEKGRLAREAEERKQEESLKQSGMSSEVREILKEGESYLAMVRRANEEIPGDEMSDKLVKLEDIMNRIFAQVRKEPKSAQDLRKFMNYYLPTTQKLLTAYVELDKQKEDIANVANTKREIESAMDTINEAFENLLDSLFEEVAWDVSSDISAMRAMMAQDGLTQDEISSGRLAEAAAREAAQAQEVAAQGQAVAAQGQAAVSGQGISLTFGDSQAQMAEEEK